MLFLSLSLSHSLQHMHKLIILNAGCCMLYILGKVLQTLLLGPLREMEAIKVCGLKLLLCEALLVYVEA